MKTSSRVAAVLAVLAASHTAEAARFAGAGAEVSVWAIFQSQHPVLMVFVNLGGLLLILGVCAIVLAAVSRSHNEF